MTTLEKIQQLVVLSKQSYSEIEKASGLTNSSFHSWKVGKSKPSTKALVKLAKYFGVTTDYLLNLSDIKYSPILLSAKYSNLLNKFNSLDKRGQLAVEAILNQEYNKINQPPTLKNSDAADECSRKQDIEELQNIVSIFE